MKRFTTKRIGNQNPRMHGQKDSTSPGEAFFPGASPSSIVEVLADPAEDPEWVRVRREKMPGLFVEGWMRQGHLDAPADAPIVATVPVGDFVRACAREELGAKEGDDPARAVLADYLIALAWIESRLENFGPQRPNSDGVGPYQLSTTQWVPIAAAESLSDADRFVALNQIPVAAAITRRDWAAFSKLARPDGDKAPDGPFVPSFLNLFHAWLIGVPAAHEVDTVNRDGDPGSPIGPILEKHHPGASNALMEARAQFLREGGQDGRVAGFVRRTTEALTEAFARAGTLLVDHFPEFVLPPGTGGAAPWMAIAEQQEHIWSVNNLTEASPSGAERIKAYFAETDHPITADAPWCGAFVAFCLAKSGNARAAAGVIKGAARAANWKTWGDIELHAGLASGQLQRGAIVVLSPGKDTGTSGHVGFLTGTTAGSNRIFLLGGNQSDRVKVSDFAISRVVAVRWLNVEDTSDAGANEVPLGPAEPTGAGEDEILTMARTLWGEARGEGQRGIEAVAAVIINRVRSPRFPNTISGVCLQPFQFSVWNRNAPGRAKLASLPPDADEAMRLCMQVTRQAAAGNLHDPTGGALHYHSNSIARPNWVVNSPGARAMQIGNHIFYTGIA